MSVGKTASQQYRTRSAAILVGAHNYVNKYGDCVIPTVMLNIYTYNCLKQMKFK